MVKSVYATMVSPSAWSDLADVPFSVTVKLFLCEPVQSSISDAVEMGESPVPHRLQPTLMGHKGCLKL